MLSPLINPLVLFILVQWTANQLEEVHEIYQYKCTYAQIDSNSIVCVCVESCVFVGDCLVTVPRIRTLTQAFPGHLRLDQPS